MLALEMHSPEGDRQWKFQHPTHASFYKKLKIPQGMPVRTMPTALPSTCKTPLGGWLGLGLALALYAYYSIWVLLTVRAGYFK